MRIDDLIAIAANHRMTIYEEHGTYWLHMERDGHHVHRYIGIGEQYPLSYQIWLVLKQILLGRIA